MIDPPMAFLIPVFTRHVVGRLFWSGRGGYGILGCVDVGMTTSAMVSAVGEMVFDGITTTIEKNPTFATASSYATTDTPDFNTHSNNVHHPETSPQSGGVREIRLPKRLEIRASAFHFPLDAMGVAGFGRHVGD